ncbi:MAG: TIGR00730 family Rossman fold protein [Calditrichaeota bacterium]|nr:TIGR00730 family Rossman fold protein [Calditrichota bacterium]MCB0296297.1 TIGR00730 family Rossman fold protein [Calditrichota bacterium]MCB0305177.1 TIGR00730 family Rossman fold protein [Calditrichota bacterium]MCB0315541.1 TIGR00730 family Rossman fold protein [Calditrichota bacterium]MCB9088993.1 TIGR00730 family Rossman fold protein [Calditrichia bacterium]
MGQPEKAYKNLEFLNSAEARILRILSEYLEPRVRFQKQDVENTIVFFGSARLIDRDTAAAQVADCQRQVAHSPSAEYQHALREAEHRLKLSRYYEDARALAKLLTEWSHEKKNRKRGYLITSGGGPGIMEAANRGASEVPGGRSVGLNISIPMEQGSNPYITDELNFEFHYFFTRKFWFVYLAKALVVFPGGFGTLDELFEVLTLIQTRKVEKPLPVVLYGADYWRQLINFDFLVDNLMINPEDMNLLYFADTPEEAFQYLSRRLNNHP